MLRLRLLLVLHRLVATHHLPSRHRRWPLLGVGVVLHILLLKELLHLMLLSMMEVVVVVATALGLIER